MKMFRIVFLKKDHIGMAEIVGMQYTRSEKQAKMIVADMSNKKGYSAYYEVRNMKEPKKEVAENGKEEYDIGNNGTAEVESK